MCVCMCVCVCVCVFEIEREKEAGKSVALDAASTPFDAGGRRASRDAPAAGTAPNLLW